MKAVIYLMQVSACTGIFYLFYYLFLRRLTFFTLNRWYLLVTLLLSFVIPALTIPINRAKPSAIMRPVMYVQQVQTINEPAPVLLNSHAEVTPQTDWMLVARYVYLVMAFISITHLLISLALFFWRTNNEKLLQIGNIRVLKANKILGNSSFMNVIFINDDGLDPTELKQIITHELLHVKLMHSADRLLARLVQVILWFNPFAYLYIRIIEENHEFEVDRMAAIDDDKGMYARLLFKLASSGRDYLLHSFSKVPVKKRIAMLFNQPTNNMKKIIYVLMLPLVVISCLAFANLKNDNGAANLKNHNKTIEGEPDSIKKKLTNHEKAEKMREKLKKFTAYLKTDEAKNKKKFIASLWSKTITVKIIGDYNLKDAFFNNDRRGILAQYDGHDFVIPSWYGQEKQLNGLLKAGDEVTVNVFEAGMGFSKDAPIEITPAYVIKNGQKIFQLAEADKIPAYPFLIDVNKVRNAEGQVSNIVKYANGKWKTALFETVNGFKFNLSFKPSASGLGKIEDGDHVRLRFVNEVKTGSKQYIVNDWVSISNYQEEIKNPELFNKYYTDEPKANAEQSVKEEGPYQVTPIKYDSKGGAILEAETDAPQSVIDEYTALLKKINLPYKKGGEINLKPDFTAADREQLKALYLQMSRKQQLQQYTWIRPKDPMPFRFKHQPPTQQQLTAWQHSPVSNYLITIDNYLIKDNMELSKYKPSDFNAAGVSIGHNRAMYKYNRLVKVIKGTFHIVGLETNGHFDNAVKEITAKKEWSMDQFSKDREELVMANW